MCDTRFSLNRLKSGTFKKQSRYYQILIKKKRKKVCTGLKTVEAILPCKLRSDVDSCKHDNDQNKIKTLEDQIIYFKSLTIHPVRVLEC